MKIDKFEYKKTKEIILDVIYDLEEDYEIETGSFNSGVYSKDLSELKEDIDKIEKILKTHNIDLFKFINDNKDKVFDDNDFTSHGALLDTMLYLADDKKGILSGVRLIDSDDGDYVFKYEYGFYNYDMGRRYILQSFDTLEDYYKVTAEKIIYEYFDRDYGCNDKELIKKAYIIKKVKNAYIVFCDLNSVFMILDLTSGTSSKNYRDFVYDVDNNFEGKKEINNGILEVYINVNKNTLSKQENKKIYNKLIELELEVYNECELKKNVSRFNL